jgi:hypothetical protein
MTLLTDRIDFSPPFTIGFFTAPAHAHHASRGEQLAEALIIVRVHQGKCYVILNHPDRLPVHGHMKELFCLWQGEHDMFPPVAERMPNIHQPGKTDIIGEVGGCDNWLAL